MASKAFTASELLFVTNNYAAPLSTENVPEAFHLIQKFLTDSEIGKALVEPAILSATQIASLWQTAVYNDGGKLGSPTMSFRFGETEYVITPTTVREALGFDTHTSYSVMGDVQLRDMLQSIGYSGSLAKLGQVKRPLLRKEWSFFFDCITRAFGKKVTNWDAIPIDSLQIGYSLLYGSNYDFGKLVLMNIGERVSESRVTVYFARFCQLLFSVCVSGVQISADDIIQPFKVHKRIFSDLINKDVSKGQVPELFFPLALQNFLHQPQTPTSQSPPHSPLLNTDQPSVPSLSPPHPNTDTLPIPVEPTAKPTLSPPIPNSPQQSVTIQTPPH
jgi:hypothetical protein